MPNAEELLPIVAGLVDHAHHGLVGGYHNAGGGRLRFALRFGQVDRVAAGQMGFEGAGRLLHQGAAVGQKQHALDPPGAHQHVHERDSHARFARARSHHEQPFAMAAGEVFGHLANGELLVGAVDDCRIDRHAA